MKKFLRQASSFLVPIVLCIVVPYFLIEHRDARTGLPVLPFPVTAILGAIIVLIYAYGVADERWPSLVTASQWGWFFWLAIPASTGSFGLWFVALGQGGATRTSGYLFLAPLFTVILSFFILHTALSWLQGAGGLLIGLALWLVNRELPARSAAERAREARSEGEP